MTNNPPGELDRIETASVDELRALQRERLRWSVRHAYENVPHYRKAFDAAAVHPDDLKALSDLAKFPFTTKASLRDNYPFGMFAVPREQVVRVHASSGTTGRPTVVGYTARDLDTWASVVARSIRAAGGRPGHIIHVAYGYGLFTGGLGAHYGAERLGCTVIPGRTDDMIILRGVNLFPTQIEELILTLPDLSPHFQLHLSKSGPLDAMTVHVERRPDAPESNAEAAAAQLATMIKNTIGVSTGIVVETPGTIERSQGKMRRTVDERPR